MATGIRSLVPPVPGTAPTTPVAGTVQAPPIRTLTPPPATPAPTTPAPTTPPPAPAPAPATPPPAAPAPTGGTQPGQLGGYTGAQLLQQMNSLPNDAMKYAFFSNMAGMGQGGNDFQAQLQSSFASPEAYHQWINQSAQNGGNTANFDPATGQFSYYDVGPNGATQKSYQMQGWDKGLGALPVNQTMDMRASGQGAGVASPTPMAFDWGARGTGAPSGPLGPMGNGKEGKYGQAGVQAPNSGKSGSGKFGESPAGTGASWNNLAGPLTAQESSNQGIKLPFGTKESDGGDGGGSPGGDSPGSGPGGAAEGGAGNSSGGPGGAGGQGGGEGGGDPNQGIGLPSPFPAPVPITPVVPTPTPTPPLYPTPPGPPTYPTPVPYVPPTLPPGAGGGGGGAGGGIRAQPPMTTFNPSDLIRMLRQSAGYKTNPRRK